MYWTNLGSRPRIERANMDDGDGRVDFVSTNLNMPMYLAIDLAGRTKLSFYSSCQFLSLHLRL